MSSSQTPEIINLLEWENQCVLSPAETSFIKKLETNKKSVIANESSQKSKILLKLKQKDSGQEEGILNRLERAKKLNQTVLGRIEEMKKFVDDYKGNIFRLNELKENLTSKINTLYNSSARIIEQQKNLMETNNLIKSYLQYYTEVARIEKEIEGISLHLAKKEVFEGNLQRHLSEINDGIMFFQSKPKFQDSKLFLDSYIKLKKKILLIIKNLFLKILNKHLTDTHQNFEKFSFSSLFSSSSPSPSSPSSSLPSSSSPPPPPPPPLPTPHPLPPPSSFHPTPSSGFSNSPDSKDFQTYYKILFPEFLEMSNTEYPIKINQILRNLLVFMENSSKTDLELNDLLIEVFKYFVYYRSDLLTLVLKKFIQFQTSHPKRKMEVRKSRKRRFERKKEESNDESELEMRLGKEGGGGNKEVRKNDENGERREEEVEKRSEEDDRRREGDDRSRVKDDDERRREDGEKMEGGLRREEEIRKMELDRRKKEEGGRVFEDLLDFGLDSCFCEFCYFLFLFGFEEGRNERLNILLESLNEKVYLEVGGVLGEELDELIEQMDIVKDRENFDAYPLTSPFPSNNLLSYYPYYVKSFSSQVLLRLKQDLMQKMSTQVQLYIQDHIANFDLKGFVARMPKSISEMRKREEEEELKKEEEESKRIEEEVRKKEIERRRGDDEGKKEEDGKEEERMEQEGKKKEGREEDLGGGNEGRRDEEGTMKEMKEEGRREVEMREEGRREKGRREEERREEGRKEEGKMERKRRREEDVFPVVVLSCRLIKLLCGRMEMSILQELIYDICNMNVGMIYKVAASFDEKFDSFLFLMKNLLFLDRCLQSTGIEILIKEHQIDFSETKKTIFELITGHVEEGRGEEGGSRREDGWRREVLIKEEGWRKDGGGSGDKERMNGGGKEDGRRREGKVIEEGGKEEGMEGGGREEGREDDNVKKKEDGRRRDDGERRVGEEAVWGYAKVLSFLYRGMPKVNETTIDVRKNLGEEIKGVTNRYIREMSFIIAKNICDFLRRFHHLKNLRKLASKKDPLIQVLYTTEDRKKEEFKKDEEKERRMEDKEGRIKELNEVRMGVEEGERERDKEEERVNEEKERKIIENEQKKETNENISDKEEYGFKNKTEQDNKKIVEDEEKPILPSPSSLLPPSPKSLPPILSSLPPTPPTPTPPPPPPSISKPSLQKDKLDFGNLLSKPMLRKQYSSLIDNLYLTSSEMAVKGRFYLNESEYLKVSGYLESVVENVILVLQQFYIVVAEHLEEEEYREVGMEDIGKVRREVKEIIRGERKKLNQSGKETPF